MAIRPIAVAADKFVIDDAAVCRVELGDGYAFVETSDYPKVVRL